MTIQVVSGGTLRDVNAAVPQVPIGGGLASYSVPWLPELSARRREESRRIYDAEWVYRSQPAVRKVVDYKVKAFTVVPLKGYIRESAVDRTELDRGSDLGVALREPWPNTPMSRFLGELFRDRELWDRWACLPVRLPDGTRRLRRLPPRLWRPIVDGFDDIVGILLGNGLRLEREEVVLWYGRDGGTASPMQAVFAALDELIEARRYREQVFARTGRFPAVVERPLDAKKWSDEAYNRFVNDFASMYAGDGPNAGGIPVLEEGMKLATGQAFSPADAQYLEGVTMGEVQVCGFFHLAPELVGARAGTFANQDAFRQGLYRETLGTYFTSFADEFNTQLVPAFEPDPRAYVDFLLEAALAGSFLEQAESYSRATGAPWMLRSETRAKQNLPPIPGTEQLIVPLNVLEGGLTSPASTREPIPGRQPKALERGAKALRNPLHEVVRDRLAGDLADFFRRQGDAVLEQLRSAKDSAPALDWQADRWDGELARVILSATPIVASSAAHDVLERFDPEYDWTDDPMAHWLRAAAAGTARRTNANTRDRILAASVPPRAKAADTFDWQTAVGAVFAEDTTSSRGGLLAQTIVTETLSFGGMEAAKAVGARRKVWRVHSARPRDTHAELDGVEVELGQTFANGLRWPGDHLGSPDETAGCTCSLDYTGG